MTNATESRERQKVYRRRVLVGFFGLMILLFIFIVVTQYRDVDVIVSDETTVYTTSVNENGVVRFLAAFEEECYSSDIETDNNGFRLVVRDVDLFEEYRGDIESVCAKIGLNPKQLSPSLSYEGPDRYVKRLHQEKKIDKNFLFQLAVSRYADKKEGVKYAKSLAMDTYDVSDLVEGRSSKPWTPIDLPLMKDWVDKNSPVLDLVAKAVCRPCFEMPFVGNADTLIVESISYVYAFRPIARGYVARANYFLGIGNTRSAMADIISLRRLGRHISNRWTILDQIFGRALENAASSVGIVNVGNDLTTKQDMVFFLDQIRNLPTKNRDLAVKHEKLMWLELICLKAKGPEADERVIDLFETEELAGLTNLGIDWNFVATEFNHTFDRCAATRDFSYDKESLGPKAIDYVSRSSRSRKLSHWIVHERADISNVVYEDERRTACYENLQQIVMAMLIYEKDHGTLPPVYSVDEKGNPLHSWRVLLLPYLGEKELYDQFRLDEPWSSPHNQALAGHRPAVFACPTCPNCRSEQTTYSVIDGNTDTPFAGKLGRSLSQFGPSSDDMILVVERTEPVHWMNPDAELALSQAELGINHSLATLGTRAPFGSWHVAGVQCGFRNGSVEFLSETSSVERIKEHLRGKVRWFGD